MIAHLNKAMLIIALLLPATAATAQLAPDEAARYRLVEAQQTLSQLEGTLSQPIGSSEIDRFWQQVNRLRKEAMLCVEENASFQERINGELALLGEAVEGEGKAIALARKTLERDRQAVEQRLAGCRFVLLKSEAVQEQLEKQRAEQQARTLLSRSPDLSALYTAAETRKPWYRWFVSLLTWDGYGWTHIHSQGLVTLGVLLLFALGTARVIGKRASLYIARHPAPEGTVAGDALAFVCAVRRYRYALMITAFWTLFWAYIAWKVGTLLPLAVIGFYLLSFYLFLTATRTFINPIPPAAHHLPFTEAATRRLGRVMALWGGVACAGGIMSLLPAFANLGDFQEALLRFIFVLIYVVVLIALVWSLSSISDRYALRSARFAITLVLLATLLAEAMGYRNLSIYLTVAITQSFLLLLLGWLVSRLAVDFYDSLDEGRYPWQQKLRALTGLSPTEHVPGLLWMRLLTTILIWGGSPLHCSGYGRCPTRNESSCSPT